MNTLAIAYRDAGKLPAAIALFEQVRDARIKSIEADHYDTLITLSGLAKAYQDSGRLTETIHLFERAATSLTRQGFPHRQVGRIIDWTIAAHVQAGQLDKAEHWRRRALAIVKEQSGADSTDYASELEALGTVQLQQKKWTDAEPLLLKGYEGMKQREKTIPPQGRIRIPEAIERLVQLYESTGKKGDSAKWRKELEAQKATAKEPVQR